MNTEEFVDIAREYERRIAIAEQRHGDDVERRDRLGRDLDDERRRADALAEALRLTMPDSEVLRAFDRDRNPPMYYQVGVPRGGSVKVYDAEGNET